MLDRATLDDPSREPRLGGLGSAGAVANPAGRLKQDGAWAPVSSPMARQVVIGRAEDGALVPLGVATGLEDPHGAVIIAVLQDYGAAHDEPKLMERGS